MKRFLGLAALILGLSVPAHAQSRSAFVPAGSTGGVVSNGGGGYGGGGGIGGGVSDFHTLPSVPSTTFRSTAVSGSDATFEPSSFLPYKEAIAVGQGILNAQHESVAEAAAENNRTRKSKAKAVIVENAAGDPVITEQ